MSETTAETAAAAWTTRRLLDWIRGHLESRGVDAPRLCSELLLAEVIGCERLRLYMEPDRPASTEERERLRGLVARAAAQEPVQYLLGRAWFLGRAYAVSPAVLVPRPATETLVTMALTEARRLGADASSVRAIDLGTGSGCIAVALALESIPKVPRSSRRIAVPAGAPDPVPDPAPDPARVEEKQALSAIEPNDPHDLPEAARPAAIPSIEVVATDLCEAALAMARANAERHGVAGRIEFRHGDLFAPFAEAEQGTFSLLCANPPYISDAEWAKVAPNVRDFEPHLALRGGPDGLSIVRRIAAGAPRWLRPGGALLVEIQYDQGPAVATLLREGPWTSVRIERDHEGHDRVAVAVRGD